MANTFSPFGFRAFGRMDGGAPTAGQDRVFILSSDPATFFTGDVVSLSSASLGTNPNTIEPWSASSGYIAYGVFAGCEYYQASINRVVFNSYFPGNIGSSVIVTAYAVSDPEQLYIAQASTTSGVVGTSMIGWGIGIASSLQSAGNTTTGVSNLALASSATSLTAASLPFRVVDVYANYAPPGVNGTSSGAEGGAILVVRPNNFARNNLNAAST
jgi:hypothetical protein